MWITIILVDIMLKTQNVIFERVNQQKNVGNANMTVIFCNFTRQKM